MDSKFTVSSTPHIKSNDTTSKIMLDVAIALLPATLVGVFYFGINAFIVVLTSVLSAVFFEYVYQKCTKQPITVSDFSAVVTGLLLAMNCPADVPLYVPIIGSFVAVIIIKQLFGGIGQNFMNPALGARAFLMASYPTAMTTFKIDAVATPTPLASLKTGATMIPVPADYANAFFGNIGGCIGEVSAAALIVGALYLFYKKVITWHIPVSYLGLSMVLFFIFGREGFFTGYPFYEILLGGILLGAFFMATDYSSSPITPKGQIIFGCGCAILTVIIRLYGGYPEGVSYSILLMNLTVPLIDKYTRPRVFGTVKKEVTNG